MQSLFRNCSFFTNVTFACIWPIWRRTSSLPVFACWFCGQRCQHSTSCSASVSFSPNSVSSFRNKLNNPLRQDRNCRQESGNLLFGCCRAELVNLRLRGVCRLVNGSLGPMPNPCFRYPPIACCQGSLTRTDETAQRGSHLLNANVKSLPSCVTQ